MEKKEYLLGLYEKAMPRELSWKEKFMAAKQAGYDFVEISIDETDEKLARLDMPEEERIQIRRDMEEVQLPIRTMCLSGHRKYPLGSNDPKVEARGLEIMEKAIQLAVDLGVRIIQLAGYDVYYEESDDSTKARFEKNLKIAAKMAGGYGVLMGFETMETELMNTVEKALFYVKKTDSPYLQIYPDCGNIMNAAVMYETDVLEDLQKGKGHIVALHLKETVPGKFREIPYGTGHVNFREIIEEAWKLGVRKYVTEFWYVGNPKWKEELHFARKMMGELLDETSIKYSQEESYEG